MKIARALAAIAILAGASGMATAQDDDRYKLVKDLLIETSDDGDQLVGRLHAGALEEGDSDGFTISINPKKTYAVRGACDFECQDLDLTVYDEDGDEIDSDTLNDDAPILLIGPGDAGGEITIEIDMSSCGEDDCVWAVGVYEIGD